MAPSTGKRLQEARLIRGLSLEDVQHLTRIRLTQLAGMENDDVTVFASPCYARGFYALYGRFLGVDLTALLKTMEFGRLKPVKSHQYLRASPNRVARGRRGRTRPSQPFPQVGRLVLLGLALSLILGAAAWFGNPQWRHAGLGRENAATSPDSTPATLPLLAGASHTPAASQTVPGHSEADVADPGSSGPSTQVDVRASPPPVLKALPVDEAAVGRGKTDDGTLKDGHPTPEVRRPAPFTR